MGDPVIRDVFPSFVRIYRNLNFFWSYIKEDEYPAARKSPYPLIAACAAASRAIGTRKGEQET